MKILIIGKGGHAGVVIDAMSRNSVFQLGKWLDESDSDLKNLEKPEQIYAFIAIGENSVRERISKMPFNFNLNIIHPLALTGQVECIGSYFGANSVIGNNSRVGNFSIVNTNSVLEHDSILGDFSHLCPGVVTGGRVKIGSRTFIGLNSTLKDGITVGDNVIIGMSSNVICDVPSNTVWFGNPATLRKEIR